MVATWSSQTTQAQTVRLFSGPAHDEGLDLSAEAGGTFTHAINFGGTTPISIQGLAFQPDTAIPDLKLQANDAIEAWETPNTFGNTSADADLATLLHSMRWATFPAELSFQLTGLDPAAPHKLQLLFVEKCCQRGFDILIDSEVILPRFSPAQLGASEPDRGVVASMVLESGRTSLEITLRGAATNFPDLSPVIQAATLEQFPTEPTANAPLPQLTLRQSPNTNTLSWPSNPGHTYQIEYSETLGLSTWLPINDAIEGSGNTLSSQDSNPARLAKPSGFYRLGVE